jgi:hypothetical protein
MMISGVPLPYEYKKTPPPHAIVAARALSLCADRSTA